MITDRTIKKLLILLVSLTLLNCIRPEKAIEQLQKPIIILAKSENGVVILKGNDHRCISLHPDNGGTKAIFNSYAVGDTLIK